MQLKDKHIDGFAALAPMAGVADQAFRLLCMQMGAAFCVSEMVSSKGIAYHSKKTAELMKLSESERPCAIQIFGDEPQTMANAARFALQFSPDWIDINMGCPAPKIAGAGSGASLMKDPGLCEEIISAAVKAVDLPVTVKMRSGFDADHINAVEIASRAEKAGAAAVTVHGRTREQFYAPPVDYEIIRRVKEAVSIPVIGNGDITDAMTAKKVRDETGCDFLMIGRGALGNPWIFEEINAFLRDGTILKPPTLDKKCAVMKQHILKLVELKGERVGMREARKHTAYYLKGFRHAAQLRKRAFSMETVDDLFDLISQIENVGS